MIHKSVLLAISLYFKVEILFFLFTFFIEISEMSGKNKQTKKPALTNVVG